MTATAFISDPILDRPALEPALLSVQALQEPPFDREATGVVLALPTGYAGSAEVEVYRRRRFIAALVLTAAVLAASQMAGISLFDFDPVGSPVSSSESEAQPAVHVVRPGDTYSAIAVELGAERPASFAAELRATNGGAELAVGQRLVIDLAGLDAPAPD